MISWKTCLSWHYLTILAQLPDIWASISVGSNCVCVCVCMCVLCENLWGAVQDIIQNYHSHILTHTHILFLSHTYMKPKILTYYSEIHTEIQVKCFYIHTNWKIICLHTLLKRSHKHYWNTLIHITEMLSYTLLKHSHTHYWNALIHTTETLSYTLLKCSRTCVSVVCMWEEKYVYANGNSELCPKWSLIDICSTIFTS